MERCDVLILGAGAAGLFAAAEAARRGRRVVVIDHVDRPGEKIRISGGGRCNFTNLSTAPDRFLSRNPRFALSALRRFTPADFIARVDAAGIAWHEKTAGQLFCDGRASQIVDMLVGGATAAGARLVTGCAVDGVTREGGLFRTATARGIVESDRLVVATGGKSIPKIGATGFGYRLAEQFGIPVVETRPALVPLTFAEQELARLKPLSGVAVEARVGCGRTGFDEALLFTHRGLSGPAILQVSSYWREGQAITVDLARGQDAGAALRQMRQAGGRVALATAMARLVPEKVAGLVLDAAGLDPSARLADQGNAVLDRLAAVLHGMELKPVGTEGYRTAEVTLGGVDTDALDARTMEAKAVPGLHFVGEVVDVTGWLGGYNFQWAWSSGWAAGQAV
ncbi:BaiN/RdsA family NAD(P)/FAD-dependent oxidoreductase [Frigidibacter oleivorans]|uniref:NAD(P)/FAD-dependent oxidoreductase n=1 Tax=Frigidibacter oleivorans TaxID=2487129 RepID=UPI000F8C98C5|nr:NAD(P)/FAD-dependent oxidoreductase [Frigidibacter oleivorans]